MPDTFIDQYNRVWLKVVAPIDDKSWLLLTDGYHSSNSRVEVGHYYTDEDLSMRSVTLQTLERGSVYKFKPTFKSGENVFVKFDAVDKVPDFNTYSRAADAVVATYVRDDESDNRKAVVELQIVVDKRDIKKYT
jgi:hypothetical protein